MATRTIRPSPAIDVDPGLTPAGALPGVGPALVAALARLGLERVQDLWFHLPLRYEDKTRITAIADLRVGERAQVEGVVEAVERGFRYRPQLKVAIGDASRQTLLLRFFHFNRAQAEQLLPGTRLLCYGEVRHGAQGLEMVHPNYQRLDGDAAAAVDELLSPVYPTTEGLGPKRLAGVIGKALALLPPAAQLELIPPEWCARHGLTSLRDALLYVHRPPPDAHLGQLMLGRHPAQQRLAFEELLTQHLSLKRMRAAVRRRRAPALGGTDELRRRLLAGLPFELTAAQRRVVAEVVRDLAGVRPMLRLVQGDVGSGKTVVAALAALAAVESGYQVALMAPTELLAEQHLRNFRHWLQPLGIEVEWLASKVTGKARKQALARVAAGAPVVIGTHALMQEGVAFARLGLVIVDEQHRFGVQQRLALRDKGKDGQLVPHQLVLTATPIPRTLAMSAYADLDVSSVDELPPGRTPVQTIAISNARRAEVIERIHAACGEGRQVYWVCTLIEESEQLRAQAAEVAHAELSAALAGYRVGLIHGRMKPKEKQAVMDAFEAGELAVLVATTVIEVGVDVPNASLMVVENSERLGLAQLHQLRGRVGRGAVASNCVLLYQPPLGQLARERLQVMRDTNDGFRIAEKDLELRGPGEVLGTRQTGQLSFRIADLARDAHLLPAVQQVGEHMLAEHPRQTSQLIERWIGGAARYAHA
ncbi:ATP-dependent DNA helicase RecG [Rhodanobacter sp. FW510-R12]|uniref:ATP-dependent DNA helicase RecG n=1 Tax=unclassified Rhodanobacter TaxID=2621553 RepID=UPI0007A9CED1|nr:MULTISPECIES: ATP-dependent DNA helicase RecG [unclassified Rhodanobacter]KZC18300.1 ATP-dependent DNA helicase RecG [Rhodanobacter sp. FW104-R8]KZC28070.1 ATP-dependent DNA helicase RecG [Rhodanobacter sp. FW510-T8]KZC33237.1 ATP-dependent DNA helicase RecG [Rhodanobacter sp. FW510-R10]